MKPIDQLARELRVGHPETREPAVATVARALVNANNEVLLDAMGIRNVADLREALGALGAGDPISSLDNDAGYPSSIDSGTPWTMARIAGWTPGGGGSAPPIRIVIAGDSLATGLSSGPLMAVSGVIQGAGMISATGGAATVSNSDLWLTRKYDNYPIGSSGVYLDGGATDVVGSEIAIYYIKESGAGTFDFEYSSNGGSSWTVAGTIDASNGTQIGAANTYSVSTSNTPKYRLRINNVTGGAVKIVGWGIYNTNGGGAILCSTIASIGGIDIDSAYAVVPTEILTPIWAAIAPDLVLSCWADSHTFWQSGGAWRTMYSRFKSAYNNTDYVQICANPASDETGRDLQRAAQFAWAREFDESYFDGYSFFRSYADANSKGMMTDAVHLNAAGTNYRNFFLWRFLTLGSVPLGRSPLFGIRGSPRIDGNESAPSVQHRGSSVISAIFHWFSGAIACSGQINIYSALYAALNTAWTLQNDGGFLKVIRGGATIHETRTSSDAGIWPGADGYKLGGTAKRWDIATLALRMNEGANGRAGTATLVAGTVTVNTTAVTANSRIMVQRQTDGGTVAASYSITRTAGASFTITAKDGSGADQTADTSTVAWWFYEPIA